MLDERLHDLAQAGIRTGVEAADHRLGDVGGADRVHVHAGRLCVHHPRGVAVSRTTAAGEPSCPRILATNACAIALEL